MENKLELEYLYTVEDYITYIVKVTSNGFSGASNFCISKELLRDTVSDLSKMYKDLEGR